MGAGLGAATAGALALSVTPSGTPPFERAMLSSTALRAAASASAAALAAESPDTMIRCVA
jgi:UDP-N-acetylglucosamine enolpyruvyl transferase